MPGWAGWHGQTASNRREYTCQDITTIHRESLCTRIPAFPTEILTSPRRLASSGDDSPVFNAGFHLPFRLSPRIFAPCCYRLVHLIFDTHPASFTPARAFPRLHVSYEDLEKSNDALKFTGEARLSNIIPEASLSPVLIHRTGNSARSKLRISSAQRRILRQRAFFPQMFELVAQR